MWELRYWHWRYFCEHPTALSRHGSFHSHDHPILGFACLGDLIVRTTKRTQSNLDIVMRQIKAQNLSVREIGLHSGIEKKAVWRYVETLREMGLIHIDRYQTVPPAKISEAVYTWGEGEDAPDTMKRRSKVCAVVVAPEDPYQIIDIPCPALPFWHDRVFGAQLI